MHRILIISIVILAVAPLSWGQIYNTEDYRGRSYEHNPSGTRWETTVREIDREQRERELEDRLRLQSPEALQEYQDWR